MRWLVLNFHGVGDPCRPMEPGESDVWLSKKRFTQILDISADRDDVLITFDDANSSDLGIAAQELEKRGQTATFFILTGKLGSRGYLSSDEVQELFARGHKIGSHGCHHVDWRSISRTTLQEEIRGSRAALEDLLQATVSEYAIPFGSYDRRVLKELKAQSPSRMYTSDGGRWNGKHPIVPRHSLHSHDDPESVAKAIERSFYRSDRVVRGVKSLVKRLR